MKIAIISDIHNNITNLKKVLDYCRNNNIEKIICCGDLASIETLDFLNDKFGGEIYYCFGNMDDGQMNQTFSPAQGEISQSDREVGAKYKNTWIFRDFGDAEFRSSASKKYKVAFTHYPEAARELCQSRKETSSPRDKSGKYDFVFYGHTHKPWEKTIGKCKMLNPGNVAGEIYPPTFAVWNTDNDKFELIRIHELK